MLPEAVSKQPPRVESSVYAESFNDLEETNNTIGIDEEDFDEFAPIKI